MIATATAGRILLALSLVAVTATARGSDVPGRIIFKNSLPEVKVQDDDAGVYFVKVVFCGEGPLDPNTNKPDYSMLPELKAITYGRPIEGKKLPGRAVDISKGDLKARKDDDPNTLILADQSRKRTIYEGPIPSEAVWLKVRYDTAIFTRKEGAHLPGARNWIAMPLPISQEDRWTKLDRLPDPCALRVIQITALVKGTFPDERDFTTTVEFHCE